MRLILISVLSLLVLQLSSVVIAAPPYDNKRGTIIYESRDTGCVWDELYPVPKHIIYFDSCTETNPCSILGTNGYVFYDFKYCDYFELLLGVSAEFPDYTDQFFIHPMAPDGRQVVLVLRYDMCGTGSAEMYFVRKDSISNFTLQHEMIVNSFDCIFAPDDPWRVNEDGTITVVMRELRLEDEFEKSNAADTSQFYYWDLFTIGYDKAGDSLYAK